MSQDPFNWQCPLGVTFIVFEGWGPGGPTIMVSGGSFCCSGAGGGAYARGRLAVTPLTIYTVLRGLGDGVGPSGTIFHNGANQIVAGAGGLGGGDSPDNGGKISGPDVQISHEGGDGYNTNFVGNDGGPGGGGATRDAVGLDATSTTPGGGPGGPGGARGLFDGGSGSPGTTLNSGGGAGGHARWVTGPGPTAPQPGGDGSWIIWDDTLGQVGGGGAGFTPNADAFLEGQGDFPPPPPPSNEDFRRIVSVM